MFLCQKGGSLSSSSWLQVCFLSEIVSPLQKYTNDLIQFLHPVKFEKEKKTAFKAAGTLEQDITEICSCVELESFEDLRKRSIKYQRFFYNTLK